MSMGNYAFQDGEPQDDMSNEQEYNAYLDISAKNDLAVSIASHEKECNQEVINDR